LSPADKDLCHANGVALQNISLGVKMPYTGNGPVERPTVLGLVVAAVWLVGLVLGVSALVVGHPVVAAVAVVFALVAPWLALAWNLHARLRADDVQLPFAGGGIPLTAG
jgi:hypothetical protein